MKVLSYYPDKDEFFVAVTWDEYRQLAAKYKIETGYGDGEVEEVIEGCKLFLEDQEEIDPEYRQYIMNLYGIDDMPDMCLWTDRRLSFLAVDVYDYPFAHMWNGDSPWKKIETVDIDDLNSLAVLECIEKGWYAPGRRDCEEKKPESGDGVNTRMENMLKSGGAYNLHWSRRELTAQKLGAFCEYYAKMTLISYGINVYTSEIDDHGIDFVAEGRNGFLKFQVKGSRSLSQYIYMLKENFNIEDDAMFLFLVLLVDGEHPDMYIIPTSAWRRANGVFVSRDYEGKKSKPDYGVNISRKNMPEIEKYRIENMLSLF